MKAKASLRLTRASLVRWIFLLFWYGVCVGGCTIDMDDDA